MKNVILNIYYLEGILKLILIFSFTNIKINNYLILILLNFFINIYSYILILYPISHFI